MSEKFDNATLREEISDYLYANAIPTHDTIESMTDDIVDIFVKRLTEFNRRPIYPVKTVIYPESRIHRYYCPVCGKQQKSKAEGDTWYCEKCGEKVEDGKIMETNIIYNIDCLTGGIDSLPDKSVDYAFTSPPYNRKRNDKYSKYDDTLEDYYGFLLKVTEKLRRVVKHHIFLNVQTNYYNKADVYRFIGTYADYIQNIIIWEKSNPMPANGLNVTNAFEYFIVIGDKPIKANHTYTKNHVTTAVNGRTSKEHKAIMNYDVADWFFKSFIPQGSLVIDPFMGLGTTAIACLNNGCKYIGYEIVPEYKQEAEKRIALCLDKQSNI